MLTMIDPVTGWFEVEEIPNKQADYIVNYLLEFVVHQMVCSVGITCKRDLDAVFGWRGILSAVRNGICSTVHTTMRATPTQLVFGRDTILNVSFEANWAYLKERKQKLIKHNNRRENAKRIPHHYAVGDLVMIKENPNRKHGESQYSGPLTVTAVNDNGTVQL